MKKLGPILLAILLSTTAQAQTSRQIQSSDITTALGFTPQKTLGFTPQKVINVMDYGAVCNGSTDDSGAFNAAIAAAKALPPGNGPMLGVKITSPSTQSCFISSTINLTNITLGGLAIDFGHIECATSGKPCIDALASTRILWEHLNIWGQQTNAPNVGVQIGRISSANADLHVFIRPVINGYFTFADFYNFASENMTMYAPYFVNSYAGAGTYWVLVQDGCNHFNITSQFVTETVGVDSCQSFNESLFFSAQFQANGTGIPIFFANSSRHKIIGGYASGTSAAAGVVVHTVTTSGLAANINLELDLHIETNLAKAIILSANASGPTVKGLSYTDHSAQATSAFIAIDSSGTYGTAITNPAIQDLTINVQAIQNTPHVFDNAGAYVTFGATIKVPTTATWIAPTYFNGTVCIYTAGTCVSERSNYQIGTTSITYTVANLPTCNAAAEGTLTKVTDASAPTYNATVAGGGAVHIPVYCNGTNWTAR